MSVRIVEEEEIYQPTTGYCVNCGVADLVAYKIECNDNNYIVCTHRKACERLFDLMTEAYDRPKRINY